MPLTVFDILSKLDRLLYLGFVRQVSVLCDSDGNVAQKHR